MNKILAFLFICICLLGGCNKRERLVIAGLEFGSSKEEFLTTAKAMGYKVEPIGYGGVFDITGNIHAFDISWDCITIYTDSINGLRALYLRRKYSETSEAMREELFRAISARFPQSEHLSYGVSIGVVNPSTGEVYSKTPVNFARIYDLRDKNNEYNGNVFYILDQDRFDMYISMSHYEEYL